MTSMLSSRQSVSKPHDNSVKREQNPHYSHYNGLIHGLDRTKAMPTSVPAAADLTSVSCLRVRQPSMATNPLSTLLQQFACARLSRPCLPESCPGVSATLTTIAFDDSSLRWLEIST